MPYTQGDRLPAERASKLGHLAVIKSPLVRKMIASFEDSNASPTSTMPNWQALPFASNTLQIIFAVDGSYQVIESPRPPIRRLPL